MIDFITRQIKQILEKGSGELLRKVNIIIVIGGKFLAYLPLFIIALPFVALIRIIRPIILIRLEGLLSHRIGHFAGNVEIYLCEQKAGINKPEGHYIDLFYQTFYPISNKALSRMWKRVIILLPKFILFPIDKMNRLIPGGSIHRIGRNTKNDRDVNNLLDLYPPFLHFTEKENQEGMEGLKRLGITDNKPFVCILVRDNAYLANHIKDDWSYHNYRDSDVINFISAAEELTRRGYYVIRMGAKVNKPFETSNPNIIDYAWKGFRTDFMDIYLGAKCEFTITTGAGWDAIPGWLFRKPMICVNHVPFGDLRTFSDKFILLTKQHFDTKLNRNLTISEIINRGLLYFGSSSDYEREGITLIENTPEELLDISIEMSERINGTWHETEEDKKLQIFFWRLYSEPFKDGKSNVLMHGKVKARYGSSYLRKNVEWLR